MIQSAAYEIIKEDGRKEGLQEGLQLTNPKVETLSVRWNRLYNPLSVPTSIIGSAIGYHPNRHGNFGIEPQYEQTVSFKNRDFLNSSLFYIIGLFISIWFITQGRKYL